MNPFSAEAHPSRLILFGFGYAILGALLSMWLFPQYASTIKLFFIAAAAIPLLYNIIKYEEEKDFSEMQEVFLLKEHGKAVSAYFMLFLGVTLALAFLFIVLPEEKLGDTFGAQISTLKGINPHINIVGQTYATGNAGSVSFFGTIFFNNLRVLVFCIVFSFLYGAGAIFVLIWNASVIAVAIGNTIRSKVASAASTAGMAVVGDYLSIGFQTVVLRYGIHGSLEIISYIVAGLAGGIISVAVIKHHYKSRKFEHIIIDSADLILLSLGILFVAGVWEVWITPFFYL